MRAVAGHRPSVRRGSRPGPRVRAGPQSWHTRRRGGPTPRLVRPRSDGAERRVGRHPLVRRQVAEQVMGLLIVSAHEGAPFSNVGSMVVTWESICGSHFTDLFSSLPDDHDGPVLSLVAKGCLPFW